MVARALGSAVFGTDPSLRDIRKGLSRTSRREFCSCRNLLFEIHPLDLQKEKGGVNAWTLLELLLVLAIIGTLGAIAVPVYNNYMDKQRLTVAIVDIRALESEIVKFRAERGRPPNSFTEAGLTIRLDPWGNPYEYLRIQGMNKKDVDGKWRKDRFLVPINSDFDLYSRGKDRQSSPALTTKVSRDDIIRANNGGFVGLASEF
jgi:general secretion pathway protein G